MNVNNATGRLCYPYGKAELTGIIKQQPADFRVSELLGFPLTGSGEHLYLFIQKTGLTTHQLIESVARAAGIQPRRIGYAGLKDKQAVTSQWLSLHLPGISAPPSIPDTGSFRILDSQWHDRKLRVGAHRANRFEVIVRNVVGDDSQLQNTLQSIRRSGFANYFGEQRFGRQDNVAMALQTLNNRRKAKRLSRSRRSLYLSALRSELFNHILSNRIEQGIWDEPVVGDLLMLNGSHSIFRGALDDLIVQRYRELDLHCAISLFGEGETLVREDAADLENSVFAARTDICETLLSCPVKRAYRANRSLARQLVVDRQADRSQMRIEVELDSGSYLTSLLNHFIGISADTGITRAVE